jgi:hypothetical protein
MTLSNYIKLAIGLVLSSVVWYYVYSYASLLDFKESVTAKVKVEQKLNEFRMDRTIEIQRRLDEIKHTDYCESNCTAIL